jgi:AraC-like DNA-binding protein
MAGLAPAAASALTFTTHGVPPQARPSVLHAVAERGLVPIVPLPDKTPRVHLVKWRLPGLGLLSGTVAGVRQDGGPADAGDLFFGINVAGASLARQHGREVTIEAGGAVAIDPDDGAFRIERPDPCRLIGLRVSRSTIPFRVAGASRAPLRVVEARTPALRLLTGYVRSMLGGDAPASVQLAAAVAAHLTELIELSLDATESAGLPGADHGVRAARLTLIKADIDRNLTDSSLTAAALAARHGITVRYLHKLFEDEAMTVSHYVLDGRLALARQLLSNPRLAGRTISSIAGDAGFGDLSYFNRTFRRRYSVTPSDVRSGREAIPGVVSLH